MHILWSCSLFALISWGKYRQFFDFVDDSDEFVKFFVLAEYVLDLFNVSTTIIGTNSYRHLYTEHLRNFHSIDRRLRSGCDDSDGGLMRYLMKFCLILLVSVCMFLAAIVYYHYRNVVLLIGNVCTYVLPYVMIMLILGKYLGMMYSIRRRFGYVVLAFAKLEILVQGSPAGEKKNSNSYGRRVQQTHPHCASRQDTVLRVVRRISELRDVYCDLCYMEKCVKNSMGCLLLGIMLTSICVITGQLFSLYEMMMHRMTNIFLYVFSCTWIMANFMKIVVILRTHWQLKLEVSSNFVMQIVVLHTSMI